MSNITPEQVEALKARVQARQARRIEEAREAERRYIEETDSVIAIVRHENPTTADQQNRARALTALEYIAMALIASFAALIWNLA